MEVFVGVCALLPTTHYHVSRHSIARNGRNDMNVVIAGSLNASQSNTSEIQTHTIDPAIDANPPISPIALEIEQNIVPEWVCGILRVTKQLGLTEDEVPLAVQGFKVQFQKRLSAIVAALTLEEWKSQVADLEDEIAAVANEKLRWLKTSIKASWRGNVWAFAVEWMLGEWNLSLYSLSGTAQVGKDFRSGADNPQGGIAGGAFA